MKTLMHCLKNENGSIMVMAVFVIILLTIIGFAATRTSVTELQIVRNVIESKQGFYIAERGIFIVADEVDGGEVDPDIDDDGIPDDIDPDIQSGSTPDYDYQVTDITTPEILTKYTTTDMDDLTWPTKETNTLNEYAYRVYYKGQGASPKGTGVLFGTYLFDITVRKQVRDDDGTISYSSIIKKGHKKLGPKN